jgi:hypothetical protein
MGRFYSIGGIKIVMKKLFEEIEKTINVADANFCNGEYDDGNDAQNQALKLILEATKILTLASLNWSGLSDEIMLNKKHIKNSGGKTGVIASEVFREHHPTGAAAPASCVAVLWDDGTFSGSVDLETLTVEEDAGSEPLIEGLVTLVEKLIFELPTTNFEATQARNFLKNYKFN